MARNKYVRHCYYCGNIIVPGYAAFEDVRGIKRIKRQCRIVCIECASERGIAFDVPVIDFKWTRRSVSANEND